MNFRYIFQTNKKHYCPKCNRKTFVRYLDNKTNTLLESKYGKCDRASSCGYWLKPDTNEPNYTTTKVVEPKRRFNSFTEVQSSMNRYDDNNFVYHLRHILDTETLNKVVNDYKIGTHSHWPGANVFWQIDNYGNVCMGKVMLYHKERFNRTKYMTTIHSINRIHNPETEKFSMCLFGLHLAFEEGNLNKKIVIVESEKTAILFYAMFPKVVALATSSLNNFNLKQLSPLKGRAILAYPDLSKNDEVFSQWSKTANDLNQFGFNIKVSDILEKNASDEEKSQGFDIGDYLLRIMKQRNES